MSCRVYHIDRDFRPYAISVMCRRCNLTIRIGDPDDKPYSSVNTNDLALVFLHHRNECGEAVNAETKEISRRMRELGEATGKKMWSEVAEIIRTHEQEDVCQKQTES